MASGGSQLWKLDLTTSRRWKGRCFDTKLKRNPLWTDPSYAWVCEAQLGEVGGSEREHHRSFLTAMSSVAFDIRLWPVKYWTCDCFTDMDFREYGHHKYLSALKASTLLAVVLVRTRFLHKQTLSQAKNVFPCCISHTMKRESLETSGMTAEHKPRATVAGGSNNFSWRTSSSSQSELTQHFRILAGSHRLSARPPEQLKDEKHFGKQTRAPLSRKVAPETAREKTQWRLALRVAANFCAV